MLFLRRPLVENPDPSVRLSNIVFVSIISGEFVLSGVMVMPTLLKLLITIRSVEMVMNKRQIGPIHPGEILLESSIPGSKGKYLI